MVSRLPPGRSAELMFSMLTPAALTGSSQTAEAFASQAHGSTGRPVEGTISSFATHVGWAVRMLWIFFG
jgi:hypothetical protein